MARIQKLHMRAGVIVKAVSTMRLGRQALNTFTGTFETASKALLLDLTLKQLTQLTEQSYKPNTLLEAQDSKTYYIFIPTNQLFAKETWKVYKQKPKDSTREALELRRFLLLVLIATASGVHIQETAGDKDTSVTGADLLGQFNAFRSTITIAQFLLMPLVAQDIPKWRIQFVYLIRLFRRS